VPEPARLTQLCSHLSAQELALVSDAFPPGGAGAAVHTQHIPPAVADALAGWQESVSQALARGSLQLGGPAAAAAASRQACARLVRLRDAWAAEEASWLALQSAGDEPQADDAPAQAQEQAAVAAAIHAAQAGSVLGELQGAVREAAAQMEMRADGVAALLGSAEALARRAEAAGRALAQGLAQAELAALGAAGGPAGFGGLVRALGGG